MVFLYHTDTGILSVTLDDTHRDEILMLEMKGGYGRDRNDLVKDNTQTRKKTFGLGIVFFLLYYKKC